LHGLYFDQSLFGGYGPQYRVWGERSDVTWNLAKVNLRVALGVRTRWFDAGVGVEDEAYASLAGSDRMVVHALAAQAHVKVFLYAIPGVPGPNEGRLAFLACATNLTPVYHGHI